MGHWTVEHELVLGHIARNQFLVGQIKRRIDEPHALWYVGKPLLVTIFDDEVVARRKRVAIGDHIERLAVVLCDDRKILGADFILHLSVRQDAVGMMREN